MQLQLHSGSKVEVRPVGAKRWVRGEVYAAAADGFWYVGTNGALTMVRASDIIPGSRNADRWRKPRKVGERAEASRLGEERVPGRAGRVHHGLVAAGEHPVAEPAVAQVLPHPLDRVQLGAVRGRVDQGQVRRHG